MEDIALFILPNTDEDEAGDSNASVQVAKLESNGKSKDTESQASNLGFSKAGDHGQTPTEFAKLLTSEEAEHISKFSLRSTTEEDQTRLPQSRTSSPVIEAGSDVDRTSYLEPEDNEEEREVWIDKTGHEYTVPELLEQGIDPNSEDSSGRTPLLIAATSNYAEDVRLLLQNGAKVDSRDPEWGLTPLSWAAEDGHEAVVKLLLEKGADVEPKDSRYGRTPLWWAAKGGYGAIVKLLLEKGADVDAKDSGYGQTRILERLMGVDVEAKDRYSQTPLRGAAERGHEAVVKLLLEKGAEIESKDGNGQTPLWGAAENGHEAVVKLLLEKGADIESKDEDGRTPLLWAVDRGHAAVVELLLEKGAEIESKNGNGQTPL